MDPNLVYDVIPRQPFPERIGWIEDGKFFEIATGCAYVANVVGDDFLDANSGELLGKIQGLVLTREDGSLTCDLVLQTQ